MKAVILAAGEGTRMLPLTSNKPKVMLPVANKPLLEHVIRATANCGVEDVVLVCGYGSETIRDYFGDGSRFGVKLGYVTQRERLGTAHAILQVEALVRGDFIVLNGDVLIGEEHLKKIISSEERMLLSVRQVENPQDFGVVEVEGNRVVRIVEKPLSPSSNLVNAGVYRFTEEVFAHIKDTPPSVRGEYEITTTLQSMIDAGVSIGWVMAEEWLDVGRPWDLLDANAVLLQRIQHKVEGEVESYATLKPPVFVGEGTIIRSGAYIVGPVVIGRNCEIGPNCYIRPYTSIADNVKIGNAVEVKNSIIMRNTSIGHLSYVGDSVIGEECNFGAGTKVANLRHDGRSVKTVVKGKVVDSKRRKLGVIMGDRVHTGINSMINVGAVVEEGAGILPGEFVRGYRARKEL
jgi:bifunctional UDP-N-acetylglucosamine pyrophosphorylase/glucosamine-1-phosphate N-acetyltransferase